MAVVRRLARRPARQSPNRTGSTRDPVREAADPGSDRMHSSSHDRPDPCVRTASVAVLALCVLGMTCPAVRAGAAEPARPRRYWAL